MTGLFIDHTVSVRRWRGHLHSSPHLASVARSLLRAGLLAGGLKHVS